MLVWVSYCRNQGWLWPCTPNTGQTAVCPVVPHWRLLAVLQEAHNLFCSPSVPCVGPAEKGCPRETWNGPNLKVQMQNTHPARCSGQHFGCTSIFAVTDTDKILQNLVKPVPAHSSWDLQGCPGFPGCPCEPSMLCCCQCCPGELWARSEPTSAEVPLFLHYRVSSE